MTVTYQRAGRAGPASKIPLPSVHLSICLFLQDVMTQPVLLRGSPPVVLAFPVLLSIVDCRAPQRNRPPAGLEYDGGPAAAFDRGIIELACPTWRRRRWAAAPARPEAAQEDGTD